jgi:type II secretory pathway pseudopilin PulG
MPDRRNAQGHTLVELTVGLAIVGVAMLLGVSALGSAADGSHRAGSDQEALEAAARAADAIARELKDAAGGTIVFSSTTPDQITFRKMIGYDPTLPNEADRRLLSAAITLRRTPLAMAGQPGLWLIERVQAGASTARLAGYIADRDLATPTAPGLNFAVTRASGLTLVRIAVTAAVPGARDGPARARRVVAVDVEVD